LKSIDPEYVVIKTGIDIKSISTDKEGPFTSVIDKNKVVYFGKIFMDASGTNAVISKKVGLCTKKVDLATGVEYNVQYLGNPSEWHLLIGKVYQGGYGWIFPLKENRAIIGFGAFDEKIVKELKFRSNKI
jgi:digeranylgeranylglycerophospholipid reductase